MKLCKKEKKSKTRYVWNINEIILKKSHMKIKKIDEIKEQLLTYIVYLCGNFSRIKFFLYFPQ